MDHWLLLTAPLKILIEVQRETCSRSAKQPSGDTASPSLARNGKTVYAVKLNSRERASQTDARHEAEDTSTPSSETPAQIPLCGSPTARERPRLKTGASPTGGVEKKVFLGSQPAHPGQGRVLTDYPVNTEQSEGKSKRLGVRKWLFQTQTKTRARAH